jgi:hypothetical protein
VGPRADGPGDGPDRNDERQTGDPGKLLGARAHTHRIQPPAHPHDLRSRSRDRIPVPRRDLEIVEVDVRRRHGFPSAHPFARRELGGALRERTSLPHGVSEILVFEEHPVLSSGSRGHRTSRIRGDGSTHACGGVPDSGGFGGGRGVEDRDGDRHGSEDRTGESDGGQTHLFGESPSGIVSQDRRGPVETML